MTIFGWDMSHFDAPSMGNAIAEGIVFTTHKAGGDATDTELPAWWAGVRGTDPAKVLLGAYWVLYPGNPTSRADAFIARLDAACPGWRNRPFILQADCEKWNGNAATVPSKADIKAFCDRLKSQMPKLRPIVYAPKWVYNDGLAGLPYPLWASSYVTGAGGFKSLYPGDSSSKWGSYSGQVPAILQYTSSATIGGQATCDANAYRGTLAQLIALVAPGWSQDMPIDSTDVSLIWNQDGVVTNPHQRGDADTNPSVRAAFAISDAWQLLYDERANVANLMAQVTAMSTAVGKILTNVTADDGDAAQILASIQATQDATVTELLAQLTSAGRSDEDVAAALRAVLGDRAAAIAALLAA